MSYQLQTQSPQPDIATMTPRPAKGRSGYVVLTPAEQARATHRLRSDGDEPVAREIGASKYAVVRGALGLEIQAGTAALIRAWLHRNP